MGELALLDEQKQYEWEIDAAVERAESDGFNVIRSTATTLLLDLDDGASFDRYRRVVRSMGPLYSLKEINKWRSKSLVGYHVVLSCKEMDFCQRVALQACLGSDPIREALAIAMHRDGKIDPSVLFQPKDARPV